MKKYLLLKILGFTFAFGPILCCTILAEIYSYYENVKAFYFLNALISTIIGAAILSLAYKDD